MSVRMAVVGCGEHGTAHLGAIAEVSAYELTAVADVDVSARDRAAARSAARTYAGLQQLIDAGVADAVLIATPTATHAELVEQALRAGLYVMCAMPLAPTAAAGYRLAQVARECGRRLMVTLPHRLLAPWCAAAGVMQEQTLGPLYAGYLLATPRFRPQAWFDAAPWRGRWAEAGGGVMMAEGYAALDQLVRMAGMPAQIRAELRVGRHRIEVEDELRAWLDYQNGGRFTVMVDNGSVPVGTRLDLRGDLGTLLCTDHLATQTLLNDGVQVMCNAPATEVPLLSTAKPLGPDADAPRNMHAALVACHQEFLVAIANPNLSLSMSADTTTHTLELVNALYLSAMRGEPVRLPLKHAEYEACLAQLTSGEWRIPVVPLPATRGALTPER